MVSSIIHLSDLHLNVPGDASWRAFAAVSSAIEQDIATVSKVAALIVSGDLGNHPDKTHLLTIKDALETLCSKCKIDPQKDLIVIPGNHDYRPYGIFGGNQHRPDVFNSVFPDWNSPKYLQVAHGKRVAIFCFDSNVSDSRINFARGLIGDGEIERFKKEYQLCDENWPDFHNAFKIALLHHHPLPIAAAEASRISDALLGLEDSGKFMRELVRRRQGIDLVLHGHKHFPAFGRIKIVTSRFGEREISVLAAGSACKQESEGKGNSFNVITFEDGEVIAERWSRDSGGFEKEERQYEIYDYENARDRSFHDYYSDPKAEGVLVTHETQEHLIGEYGDCHTITTYDGITVAEKSPPLKEFIVESSSTAGQYGMVAVLDPPAVIDVRWESDPQVVPHRISGRLVFDPPIVHHSAFRGGRSEAIKAKIEYRNFNGFAMTVEQGEMMYGKDLRIDGTKDTESVSAVVRRPTETLEIRVKFHESMPPPAVRIRVLRVDETRGGSEEYNQREEYFCRRFLQTWEQTVILKVLRPRSGHRYGFSWPLPAHKSRSAIAHDSEAAFIRRKLLALDTKDLSENPLQEPLRQIRKEIYENYRFARDTEEDFAVSVIAFDPIEGRLRSVAGAFHPAYWGQRQREGEGIVGRAHKQNASILYIRGEVVPGQDYASSTPPHAPVPEFLFVLPLRHPMENSSAGIVGLLCLATTSLASGLLKIKSDQPQKEALTAFMYQKWHENIVLKHLLPKPSTATFFPSVVSPTLLL